MKILFALAVLLFGQMFAYLPYYSLFDRGYFYWSIGAGVAGLVMLLWLRIWRKKKEDFAYEDDGLYPSTHNEFLGSQSIGLTKVLDHHQD
ncbi:hypothetical protein RF679_02500 [Undibacterium cyanobacteriorum]|uniref:Uncharacterized protein n=1 Tax=Undibacterium cyanobacteriorum TaxID=3073561 RepID=A0ABY9RJP8_9BURK|nr:hypothetical protein [Undibacterium sp. 20NA77.5]WMW81166.1 hypothetical protein RF679_02500 [Undibacterium sp. 20NA77.5]